MHAYLLVSQGITNYQLPITNLASKLQAKIMEYPLTKIEDVRNLNNLLRLTLSEKTLIFIKNIHEAGTETLNAFLKNLEEPQENVYFALTAPSARKVLPTIVSRCQIIKVQSTESKVQSSEEIEKFSNMKIGQQLQLIDKIKDRVEAINFVENLIYHFHDQQNFDKMNILIKTRARLKANGNVNLQLSNLVINT